MVQAHTTMIYTKRKQYESVFGECAYQVAVSSTESMTGHLLGASGAIEAVFSILAIKEGILPPTIHYETPDEELNLGYVPKEGKKGGYTCCFE